MKFSSRSISALVGCGVLVTSMAFASGPDPDRHIVKFTDAQAGKAAVAQAGGQILKDLPQINAAAARLPARALSALQLNPFIEYIERDLPRYPMGEVTPFGISMVQADQVSDSQAANRTVCIIDSGYDLGHPDLPTNVSGYNGNLTWHQDGSGHGTHVAGTVAALGGNGIGVVGVNPSGNLGLFIVRVFGDNGSWAYSSNLIDAAYRCRDGGAHVINMSLGCSGGGGGPFSCSSSAENSAFQDLYDNFGILSIAAAGNAGNTSYSYPASYASVVSVAAVDELEVVADFSQRNDRVELSAPGVGVLSTVPVGTGYNVQVSVGSSTYEAAAMQNATLGSATGPLVDCGIGNSPCPGGGGQVCLIERGVISFAEKTLNCQAGGGVAAIIYNNVAGMLFGTLGDNPSSSIPSVGTSNTDGAAMLGQTGQSTTVTLEAGDYDYFNGTSMATPHVAGVAALVWSHNTGWTNAQIREALAVTAKDLGAAGRDNVYGYGLIQAKAALDYLSGGTTNSPPNASFTSSCSELTCDFTDTSTDSDGTIVSWSWSFGDGASSSAQHPSHTYGANGTYTVTLTVTDDGGASDTTSGSVSVSGPTVDPTTMHVASISASSVNFAQGFKAGVATVVIRDNQGNAVGNATVTGTFTGDVSGSPSGTTGGNGSVSLQSSSVKGRLRYTFCVDSVSHASLSYDAPANAATCVSF